MSEGRSFENIIQDVTDFTTSFGVFHEAFPNENQHLIGQIVKQIKMAEKTDNEYIRTDKGQEQIWTFEKKGVKVYKRVFHPGRGEWFSGADFILYKITSKSEVKVSAVQVKRNRNEAYFEFESRDLKQLERISSWGSAYYLMVDETTNPPLHCFLTVNEISKLLGKRKKPPIRIPNTEIRNYCRGANQFYNLFYRCIRGSKYVPEAYKLQITDYISKTNRVIVEISTQRVNNRKIKREKQTDLPDYTKARIKGLLDGL